MTRTQARATQRRRLRQPKRSTSPVPSNGGKVIKTYCDVAGKYDPGHVTPRHASRRHGHHRETLKRESLKGTGRLQPTKAVIRSYSGDGPGPALLLLGCFTTSLSRNQKSIVEVVYVVKGQGNTALLSRQAGESMGLIEYHIEQITKVPFPTNGGGTTRNKQLDRRVSGCLYWH